MSAPVCRDGHLGRRQRRFVAAAALLAAAAAACEAERAPPEEGCSAEGCEAVASRAELLAAIAEHRDPVAAWLRGSVGARGTLAADYRALLAGVGEELGCGPETEQSFVVLSNTELVPKTIFVRCARDPQAASRFFLAVPSLAAAGVDIEPGLLHVAAWDASAEEYRHYATHPGAGGELRVSVKPSFCARCHGGPHRLPFWQPLMNEITNPWSQWVAEPGFTSQLFHEHVDPALRAAPVYRQLTAPGLLASASELEPIVRAGIDRVTDARIGRRLLLPDAGEALALLRPIFCDETVNFVSEVHGGGEIRSSVAIDDGTRALMARALPAAGWAWLRPTLRLPPRDAGQPALTLTAVRGVSTEAAELALASRGILSARELLRARALDWAHPVGSSFRCDRFLRGRAVMERRSAASWNLPAAATTGDLAAAMYRELLADLAPPRGADLIAIERPSAEPVPLTLAGFGTLLETAFRATSRARVDSERRRRACDVAGRFPTAPLYPDFHCSGRTK